MAALGRGHDDDLEQVAGSVWADDEPVIRILPGVFDCKCMFDRMEHVVLLDPVLPGRGVKLHHF